GSAARAGAEGTHRAARSPAWAILPWPGTWAPQARRAPGSPGRLAPLSDSGHKGRCASGSRDDSGRCEKSTAAGRLAPRPRMGRPRGKREAVVVARRCPPDLGGRAGCAGVSWKALITVWSFAAPSYTASPWLFLLPPPQGGREKDQGDSVLGRAPD